MQRSLLQPFKFSLRFPSRYYSSGIFSKRESALEEKFILEHEKKVLEDFRKLLAEKEAALHEKLKKIEENEKKNPTASATKAEAKHNVHYSPMGGASSAFGKREAVAEEQYIRSVEKEKLSHKDDKSKE